MKSVTRPIVVLTFAASLAGCSGASLPPSQATSSVRSPANVTATVIFTLDSSGRGTIHERASPAYVSRKTRFINIALNGGAQSQRFPCNAAKANYHCKFVLSSSPGRTQFLVMEYGDSGDELAETKFVRRLKSGTNNVNATLHGIVGSVELSIDNPFYVTGRPAKQEVNVTALDYGGAVILGPDTYDHPIVVKNSDRSGSTRLSRTTLTSPVDRLYLNYTGSGCAHATLTADAARVTFEPEVVPGSTYELPSSGVIRGANMVLGTDGAIWFMETRRIARVATSGQITEYAVPSTSDDPYQLTVGPDGHIWFATGYGDASSSEPTSAVERLNDDGSISMFPLPTPPPNHSYYPAQMISGPQNNLWLAYGFAIYTLTTSGAYSQQVKGSGIGRFFGMAEGPDGNIWTAAATESGTHKYTYVPGGALTALTGPIASMNADLFLNAEGTLYLLGLNGAAVVDDTGKLVQRFSIPGTDVEGTPSVGGGSIWIPMPASRPGYPSIGRIRLSDHATCSYVLPIMHGKKYAPLLSVAVGSDGKLWFSSDRFLGKAAIPEM